MNPHPFGALVLKTSGGTIRPRPPNLDRRRGVEPRSLGLQPNWSPFPCDGWCARSDLNRDARRRPLLRRLRLPVPATGANFGTRGGIRTHTVLFLRQTPPANWATRALLAPRLRLERRLAGLESAVLPIKRSRCTWWAPRDLNPDSGDRNSALQAGATNRIRLMPKLANCRRSWRWARESNSLALSLRHFSRVLGYQLPMPTASLKAGD